MTRETLLPSSPTALKLPEISTRRIQIEAPVEMAPVSVPMLPVAVMPALAVRPVVRVGLLETPEVSPAAARAVATNVGFDAGSQETGARRARGTAGAAFGESETAKPAKAMRRTVRGGFDETEEAPLKPATTKVDAPEFEGLEILEKPQPIYTEEGRRLRIEGTVKLRVVFSAAGEIQVVSVVKGLGHGLDEAAVRAATAIRFRPARRAGRPVDAPAVIQIHFQLA